MFCLVFLNFVGIIFYYIEFEYSLLFFEFEYFGYSFCWVVLDWLIIVCIDGFLDWIIDVFWFLEVFLRLIVYCIVYGGLKNWIIVEIGYY